MFSPFREWDVLNQYYENYTEDNRSDAQRIGSCMLDFCLKSPISHPSTEPTRELHTRTSLLVQWQNENNFGNTCAVIRTEEIPPEELTDEMRAAAIRPTYVEEQD
jgi:hypothetical protein